MPTLRKVSIAFRLADGFGHVDLRVDVGEGLLESQSPFGLLTDWDPAPAVKITIPIEVSQSPFGLLTDWDKDDLTKVQLGELSSQSPFGLLTDWDSQPQTQEVPK